MTTEKKEVTELKRNTGFMHVSTEKKKENAPDFFGNMNIDGIDFKLAGWKKESKANKKFFQINFDRTDLSEDEVKQVRADHLEQFNADRKKPENKDKYLLIECTGTLHKAKADKKEDFFGKVMIGGVIKYLVGYAGKNKQDKPMIRLEISENMLNKEQRTAIADEIL